MAIHIKTSTPRKLLATYKKAIDDGHVKNWSYDKDGDFTYINEDLSEKAWLRPKITPNQELILYILSPKEKELSTSTYALYHGNFIESMLNHCDRLFSIASASSMPEKGDIVG